MSLQVLAYNLKRVMNLLRTICSDRSHAGLMIIMYCFFTLIAMTNRCFGCNRSGKPEKILPLQHRSPDGGNSTEFRLIADSFMSLTFLHGLDPKRSFNVEPLKKYPRLVDINIDMR